MSKDDIRRGADPIRSDRPTDTRSRKSQMAMNKVPTRYSYATREIETREIDPMDAKLTNAERLALYHASLKPLKPSTVLSRSEIARRIGEAEAARPKVEAHYTQFGLKDPSRRVAKSQYFREKLRQTLRHESGPVQGSMYNGGSE